MAWNKNRLRGEEFERVHALQRAASELRTTDFCLDGPMFPGPVAPSTCDYSVDYGDKYDDSTAWVQRVLLDAFHGMDRVLKTIPTAHGWQPDFKLALRDAIFLWHRDDYDAVIEVCQRRGWDFQRLMKCRSSYVLRRVRRIVPKPSVLVPRLKQVIRFYSNPEFVDAKSGGMLVTQRTRDAMDSLIRHAALGCLSDPRNVSLYYVTGVDADGLKLYRCSRGTNAVEGRVHQPLNRLFGAQSSSPELCDNVLADYRARTNQRLGALNRPGESYIGFPDAYIVDEIVEKMQKIYGQR